MYNRYIPNGTAYTRVVEEDAPDLHVPPSQAHAPHIQQEPTGSHHTHQAPPRTSSDHAPPPPPEKKGSFLSGLLKSFHLEDLDTGDILLLLILVFLVLDGDGDNLELIITLGLVILFSLGDKKKDQEDSD